MRQLWPVLGLVLALSAPAAARADDVTDQIDQAVKAYHDKDLTTAVAALDAAAGLIRQMKTEGWKAALPEPLPGWTADKPEGTAIAPALLGGATTVSRVYHKGGDSVTVSIVADSPLVQGIAAFLSSGIVGLIANAQITVVDGRRVLFNKDENSYQTMVGERVLVKVEAGKSVDDRALRQYLGAVDIAKIEKMTK